MTAETKALTKTLAVLLVTLLIGMLAGAALTGAVIRERAETVRSMLNGEGFVAQISDVVGPKSSEQAQAINPILEKAGSEIAETASVTQTEVYYIFEKMMAELKPHLTEEQMNNLEVMRQRIRDRVGLMREAPE